MGRDREVLVSYQSAQNEVLMDVFYAGADDARWPRLHWVYKLPQPSSTRRIRLIQTETPPSDAEQWNITELRFYGPNGAEIPRGPAWKLRASPNPWDVHFAFDNSPVTRWRSWQRAAPGMYLEVEFGSAQNISRVEIQSSFDNANCKAKLMIERNNGTLEGVEIQPEIVEVKPRFWMRREAT
ncbi:MAG: discoidin domain-containing protein, partial [Burkholderiales bacterium]|nr:discoidin domain-containing protein [Burkholderiales bacterium]